MSGPRKSLTHLSHHLIHGRAELLRKWREAVRSDPQLVSSADLTRTGLEDHMPILLRDFEQRLQADHPLRAIQADMQQREDAREHGRQRWQQGYDIRETMREWGHLQAVILAELERYAETHPQLEPEVMSNARGVLTQLCMEGNCESAARYMQMQQAEAASRARDLESSLRALQVLENERAALLRETAHDLRGSIGVIANTTALLAQQNATGPERERFYGSLQRRIQATGALLNDLVELARLEAGQVPLKIEFFDAAERVRDFCEVLRPVAVARNLELNFQGPASLAVEGDALKLQRIVQNLLVNALQATERGGVTVQCAAGHDGDPQHWALSVSDTGPGFALQASGELRHALKRATEEAHKAQAHAQGRGGADGHEPPPLQRAASGPESGALPSGEGIGLSIVKRLCALLGAVVELETAPEFGTTVRVTLPMRYS